MLTVRRVLVSTGVAAFVLMAGQLSFGHTSSGGGHHESHEGEHKAGHEAHHDSHKTADQHEHHQGDHHHVHAHHHQHHDNNHDHQYAHHPWSHATEGELTSWFAGWGWNTPIYYEYGGSGLRPSTKVVLNVAPTPTAVMYPNSVPVTTNLTESTSGKQPEPLPLGTFSMVRQGDAKARPQTLQLAVDKDGNISGELLDPTTKASTPVRGSIDRATQRATFSLGDKSGSIAETGIYNLSRDDAPLSVRTGNGKEQRYSLVREGQKNRE